ncbi:lysine N(6)-hydroxylase/L-ornithine N(5)-oxygenase family protein [Flavobacterium johnsoniae]|jgi:lysine N6-hydroxylase|uniref:lysine N(6)-hydroxylase/L-ornithine N(5)-oxygenase family protein n=1 Tax=Flavobacterium johnsoniae TaxID=986 RepID=UPI0011F0542F|nr:SidA/IucD/PvdA family monooxygenase [Flavobacterium johnsoniae]
MEDRKVYSLIGIGIGPFNLGLAALLEPVDDVSSLFFDQREQFNWHPGLLFDHVTLQTPFLCDCVSMADPTSKFSFLNFLKKTDRLYKFFIRENFFVLRKEYNLYCQWVIKQLQNCRFSSSVREIYYRDGLYELHVFHKDQDQTKIYYAEKLVLGTGTVPILPDFVDLNEMEKVCHTSSYLFRKEEILEQDTVTVIGSGQSAAEVFFDLLQNRPKNLKLNWYSRPDRFFAMEYSKLILEHTSPDYIDYFHQMSASDRKVMLDRQKSQFKGVNFDLLNEIYDYMYALSVDNDDIGVKIRPNIQLDGITTGIHNNYELHLEQVEQHKKFTDKADYVILGTGYHYQEPQFLKDIQHRISRTSTGSYDVKRNYTIDNNGSEIFVQNAEIHTHSYISSDLGMGAYRNSYIINEVAKREVYKLEKRIAFQDFDLSGIAAEKAVEISI